MQLLSTQERTRNLNALANNQFDVVVIGGGVTGAGVALDAATRGYTVALVEKTDFACGTSSKSTKLVHGGIRYLPNFDFSLVHEALTERGLLLQNAPFLVSPLGFILPIYEGDRHPVGMPFTTPQGIGLSKLLDVGLWMYDGLAGRRNFGMHKHLTRSQVLEAVPMLLSDGLKEGFMYYDAQTNDVRLTLTLIRTAARYGAVVTNYTPATSFIMDNGKISGVQVHDMIDNLDLIIRARHVVNATGVFAEKVEMLTGETPQIQVEPSKGAHLVFSKEDLQLGNDAVVLPETEDKRILFIVPWMSRAIFGTTDTGTGDLDHPVVTQEDIAYLLKYLNRYYTRHFTENDIISTYAGYRPLVKPRQKNASTAKLSRTHAVIESPTGLVTITGGKLTTYRRMAQDTMDVISKRDGIKPMHTTESLPLQGSAAWPVVQQELSLRATRLKVPSEIIQHLGHSYGSEAHVILDYVESDPTLAQQLINDLPYIKAEVMYACQHEMAMTPTDVLARRTSIMLEDRLQGRGVIEEVAELMAHELHWSPEREQQLIQNYNKLAEGQTLALQR